MRGSERAAGAGPAANEVQSTTDVHEYSVVAKIMTARQNKNSLSIDPFLSSTTVLPVAYIYLDGCLLLSLFYCVLYSQAQKKNPKKTPKNQTKKMCKCFSHRIMVNPGICDLLKSHSRKAISEKL